MMNEIEDNIEKETIWTDDLIRWEGGNKRIEENPKKNDDDEDDDDDENDETAVIDIFQDNDPTETFSFQFQHSITSSSCITNTVNGNDDNNENDDNNNNTNDDTNNNNNNNKRYINIEIHGYKYESDEIWHSTGLTLWRASQHLCNYMIDHAEELNLFPSSSFPQQQQQQDNNNNINTTTTNQRILELGAGLGLVGILAHRMTTMTTEGGSSIVGTTTVCLTDGDTDALVKLRENIKANQVVVTTTNTTNTNTGESENNNNINNLISCHQLIWGRETSELFLKKYHGNSRGQQQQTTTYDLILASDIIYAVCIIPPLWETIQTLLRRPTQKKSSHQSSRCDENDENTENTENYDKGGIFLMAFARRRVPVSIEYVLQSSQDAGFSYECKKQDEKEGIFVYQFQWAA